MRIEPHLGNFQLKLGHRRCASESGSRRIGATSVAGLATTAFIDANCAYALKPGTTLPSPDRIRTSCCQMDRAPDVLV